MVRVAIDIGTSYGRLIIDNEDGSLEKRLIKTAGFLESATNLIDYAKKLHDFSEVIATGGGSSHLPLIISGVSLELANELEPIGAGELALSKLQEATVVSMGTGTAILHATPKGSTHLGATGVGGGTLQGLSRLLIGEDDPSTIEALAFRGDHAISDLTVGDLYPKGTSSSRRKLRHPIRQGGSRMFPR